MASKFLQFQKSKAWTVSYQLLQKWFDLETCFFATQMMRSKIQNSFQEVPANKHGRLWSNLLTLPVQPWPATNLDQIVIKLCEALADLVLLISEWISALSDPVPLLEQLLLLPE